MPVTEFYGRRTAIIDAVVPTTNFHDVYQVGVVRIGGSKTFQRNVVHTFDLTTPDVGPDLPANATISAADFWGKVTTTTGTVDVLYSASRLEDVRAAYDYLTATWNEWKSGSPWTAPGGDVAPSPAPVTYHRPTTPADVLVASGFAALALDALANRGGLLQLVQQLVTIPADPDYSNYAMNAVPSADCARIVVTWADPSALAARIDHPQGALPGSRPATAGGAVPPAPPARTPRTRRPDHGR
jgi:hypothetical protein